MIEKKLIRDIAVELDFAQSKFPQWPTDPIHAAAIVEEECGELVQAALEMCYEPGKSCPGDMRQEAIQVAAMAIRFLASMKQYEYGPGKQHDQ